MTEHSDAVLTVLFLIIGNVAVIRGRFAKTKPASKSKRKLSQQTRRK